MAIISFRIWSSVNHWGLAIGPGSITRSPSIRIIGSYLLSGWTKSLYYKGQKWPDKDLYPKQQFGSITIPQCIYKEAFCQQLNEIGKWRLFSLGQISRRFNELTYGTLMTLMTTHLKHNLPSSDLFVSVVVGVLVLEANFIQKEYVDDFDDNPLETQFTQFRLVCKCCCGCSYAESKLYLEGICGGLLGIILKLFPNFIKVIRK